MDFYETNEKRRTVRKFKAPATEAQLRNIIREGTKAPSARNTQGWEFVIVDDPALIDRIGEIKYVLNRGNKPRGVEVEEAVDRAAQAQKDSLANANLIMVYHAKGVPQAAGAWCCIQNMLLAATAEGLGSKISFFAGDAVKEIAELLQVPDDMELATAVSFGVPAEEPQPRSLRPEGSWLHRNRF